MPGNRNIHDADTVLVDTDNSAANENMNNSMILDTPNKTEELIPQKTSTPVSTPTKTNHIVSSLLYQINLLFVVRPNYLASSNMTHMTKNVFFQDYLQTETSKIINNFLSNNILPLVSHNIEKFDYALVHYLLAISFQFFNLF